MYIHIYIYICIYIYRGGEEYVVESSDNPTP